MEFKKPNRSRRPPAPTQPHGAPARVAVYVPPRPVAPTASPAPEEPAPKKKFLARRLLLNKKSLLAIGIIGCVAVAITVRGFSSNDSNATIKKPEYQTVLPKGKTINELGGWKRVSPPKDTPIFAFTDTIDGIPVSVTEQPLPQSFKTDTDNQVADLAKKFNATDKIDAAGTPVYIGTSVKGPQSVIFASGNLLILIKSEKKVSDMSWATYAQSLN